MHRTESKAYVDQPGNMIGRTTRERVLMDSRERALPRAEREDGDGRHERDLGDPFHRRERIALPHSPIIRPIAAPRLAAVSSRRGRYSRTPGASSRWRGGRPCLLSPSFKNECVPVAGAVGGDIASKSE